MVEVVTLMDRCKQPSTPPGIRRLLLLPSLLLLLLSYATVWERGLKNSLE